MLIRLLAGLVLAVVMLGGAIAGPLEDGEAAYQRGDYATALTLLRPLAEQGNDAAQYDLGYMYASGQGVPKDFAEAAKWERLAAQQGERDAQNILGAMYSTGHGVPQDFVLAHMWFNLAAAQGDTGDDTGHLAALERDAVSQKMTPEQIAEAQRMAREWKPRPK